MPSPPKPWESRRSSLAGQRINNTNRSYSSSSQYSSQSNPIPATTSLPSVPEDSTAPALPPTSDNNMNRSYMGSGYGSGYNSGFGTGYGSSYGTGYGSSYGTGYGSTFGSGYGSGFGSSYGSGYGSYGGMGYGGMMGGYGSGYGGYGRMGPHSMYGMGGPGMPGRMGIPEEPSLAAQMAQSTQSTFQILERVVGTFGGVAQMLESTFFATQSSFMAMVGVAEQFGMLKHMFTQIFSVFTIYRWVRNFMYRILGKRPPIDAKEINANDFQKFADKPKYSLRPFLMFLSLVFGVPYLLHLFMRSVARRLAQQKNAANGLTNGPLDGSQTFEFAQALYEFQGQNPAELTFSKGDLIAILSKGPDAPPIDGSMVPQWWQGRLRDGRVGMFPNNYVEILEKKIELPNPSPIRTSHSHPLSAERVNTTNLPKEDHSSLLSESQETIYVKSPSDNTI